MRPLCSFVFKLWHFWWMAPVSANIIHLIYKAKTTPTYDESDK